MILYRSYYRSKNYLVSDFLILSVTFQYASFTPPVIVVFFIEIYESSYFFAGKVTSGVCLLFCFALILIVIERSESLVCSPSQKDQIKLKKREKMKIYSLAITFTLVTVFFFIIILYDDIVRHV